MEDKCISTIKTSILNKKVTCSLHHPQEVEVVCTSNDCKHNRFLCKICIENEAQHVAEHKQRLKKLKEFQPVLQKEVLEFLNIFEGSKKSRVQIMELENSIKNSLDIEERTLQKSNETLKKAILNDIDRHYQGLFDKVKTLKNDISVISSPSSHHYEDIFDEVERISNEMGQTDYMTPKHLEYIINRFPSTKLLLTQSKNNEDHKKDSLRKVSEDLKKIRLIAVENIQADLQALLARAFSLSRASSLEERSPIRGSIPMQQEASPRFSMTNNDVNIQEVLIECMDEFNEKLNEGSLKSVKEFLFCSSLLNSFEIRLTKRAERFDSNMVTLMNLFEKMRKDSVYLVNLSLNCSFRPNRNTPLGKISDEGIKSLRTLILSYSDTLKSLKLDLSNNPSITDEGVKYFAEILKKMPKLKQIQYQLCNNPKITNYSLSFFKGVSQLDFEELELILLQTKVTAEAAGDLSNEGKEKKIKINANS